MKRVNKYSILLLAGGKNTRMKKNKAELLYEGKTFVEWMVEKGQKLGITDVYLSGFEWKEGNVLTVWDEYPDRGPLGGIHACMKKIRTPFCLVLPIDAPKLPEEILEALLDYHEKYRKGRSDGEKEIPLIWEHGERKEPLIAVYPTVMADAIGELIRDYAAPVFRMLDRWGYECFRKEISVQSIINVNTPELYRALINGESNEMEKRNKNEKKTISIRKIRNGIIFEKKDEVAIEQTVEFALKDGRKVKTVCTPSYMEEMILGRRFLMKDLTEQELGTEQNTEPLKQIFLKDIVHIESEMFEKPGSLFQDTGCAHSCVLAMDGRVLVSIEDIGRHNALDKVIGYAIKNRIPIPKCVAFCSGRISGDYLQKAIDAGFQVVISRAAVTSSAVELAKKENITLLGFVRKGSGNIYHEGSVVLKNI